MKKTKLFIKSLTTISASLMFALPLTSCVEKKEFYLANFENYISDDLMGILYQEYSNFNFRSYATNEDLERNFTSNYDVAIPSTYLIAKMATNKQLEVLDWSKFQLLDDSGNLITKASQALSLFTQETQSILTNVYKPYWEPINDVNYDPNGGLLNFCVPYFLQDFIFGYKEYKNISFDGLTDQTWKSTIEKAKENILMGNGGINKIAMIDDYRSIYSIPRLIESNNENVNPRHNQEGNQQEIINIETFQQTYSHLQSGFKQNSFLLNSDSNTILNDFADQRGSDAAILYNGDFLYAIQGGDNNSGDGQFEEWLLSQFNQDDEFIMKKIRPSVTLTALDGLVINKNSKNKDQAYDVIKKIALEGASSDQTIEEFDELSDSYIYGPMLNFDYVQYTSPIQKIYSHVASEPDVNGDYVGYFSDYEYLLTDGVLNQAQYDSYIHSLIDAFSINSSPNPQNTIEQNLSDINKSNMYYAFQNTKQYL